MLNVYDLLVYVVHPPKFSAYRTLQPVYISRRFALGSTRQQQCSMEMLMFRGWGSTTMTLRTPPEQAVALPCGCRELAPFPFAYIGTQFTTRSLASWEERYQRPAWLQPWPARLPFVPVRRRPHMPRTCGPCEPPWLGTRCSASCFRCEVVARGFRYITPCCLSSVVCLFVGLFVSILFSVKHTKCTPTRWSLNAY